MQLAWQTGRHSFNLLCQAVAAGGLILFSILPIWVFGREFTEHTVKELLSLPTSREMIVGAKFLITAAWAFILTFYLLLLGLIVGYMVVIPGWSMELLKSGLANLIGAALLTIAMLPFVAFFASLGQRLPAAFRLGFSDHVLFPNCSQAGLGRLVPMVGSRPV